jgi:hypothetical protein
MPTSISRSNSAKVQRILGTPSATWVVGRVLGSRAIWFMIAV